MGYWDATDAYLRMHGGEPPICGFCGKKKFAIDDYGRFRCFCEGASIGSEFGLRFSAKSIPQVDVAGLPDEEKAAISPINRLNAPPTDAEAKVLEMLLKGPSAMDDPAYAEACEALEKERQPPPGTPSFNADTYSLPCEKDPDTEV